MCDYSLRGIAARPTRIGDKLLPGTEVAFENKVERHLTGFKLLFRRTKPLPHRVARFRQVNTDNPCTHHDALEFPDSQIVLITHLRERQRATVLQLSRRQRLWMQPNSLLCRKRERWLTGSATRRQAESLGEGKRDTFAVASFPLSAGDGVGFRKAP
jgi:hypothetical protein